MAGGVEDWSKYSGIQSGEFKKYLKTNPPDNPTIPLLIYALGTSY